MPGQNAIKGMNAKLGSRDHDYMVSPFWVPLMFCKTRRMNCIVHFQRVYQRERTEQHMMFLQSVLQLQSHCSLK